MNHPRTRIAALSLACGFWAMIGASAAAQDRGGDYMDPELRRRVEQLKRELRSEPTGAESLLARTRVLWEWTNAYAMTAEEPSVDDLVPLLQRFTTATLFCFAVLEGVALYAIVLHLLGRNRADLLIALAPVVLMLACFPTLSRWRRFAGLRLL